LFVACSTAASCTNTSNHPASAGTGGGAAAVDGGLDATGGAGGAGSGTSGTTGAGGAAAGTTGTVIGTTGTGYLWYAGVELNAFTQSQTAASTDSGPAVTVVPTTSVGTFHDLVFDHTGRLWTLPTTGNQILRFPAAGLGAGASPVAELVVNSPALLGPQALAFDPSGNLWVVNFAGAGPSEATIVRFDGVQSLSGTMTLTPAATIAPAADAASRYHFSEGTGLAFDAAGNLWFAGVSAVLRIDHPSGLSGSVIASPTVVLSTGEAYTSIAFGADGALWITGTLQGFFALRIDSPATITGVVAPTPATRVALPTTGATFVGGLAFDKDGALWVVTSNRILKLASPGGLVGQVTAAPVVTLGLSTTVMPGLASKLVFQPQPSNLPVY
jgi:sugar lactone lactonase YvrE